MELKSDRNSKVIDHSLQLMAVIKTLDAVWQSKAFYFDRQPSCPNDIRLSSTHLF
jgi:hypothetical protein